MNREALERARTLAARASGLLALAASSGRVTRRELIGAATDLNTAARVLQSLPEIEGFTCAADGDSVPSSTSK